MSGFTRVNGDFKQVANYDAPTYSNTGVNELTTGVTVQPQGPKLEFFTVTATGALVGADVDTIVKTIQQLTTIYMYEYTDTTNDTLAVAVYPVGAWTTTSLNTAIGTAGVSGTTTTATATFSN
jgi:hypothetical protein